MKSIKKFILQKLKFAEPKDLGKNNALTKFLDTFSQEEKDNTFLELSQAKQIQYTQAITQFQIEAMGDIGEAVIKSLTMFALKLHKENITDFSFEQSFYGTKENLKEELFSIKFTKLEKVEKSEPMIEYADKNTKEPRRKTDSFFQQTDIILEIVQSLNGQFPMNHNNELPLRASCILLVGEFMSQCNMETVNATLEGLMDGDNNLNASYKVEATRKEFALTPDSYPSKKKLF